MSLPLSRSANLPLYHLPDISGVTFKPESIVKYLAALGIERSEAEEKMLVRFLSASTMRSLVDTENHSLLSLDHISSRPGPWVVAFTTVEAQQHAQQRRELAQHTWRPTEISFGTLIHSAPAWSAGVALDPFSTHAAAIRWTDIRRERQEYERLSAWQPPYEIKDEPIQACVWDPDLCSSLQQWIQEQTGIAQIVLGASATNPRDGKIVAFLDCVPSEAETCSTQLRKLLSQRARSLPIDNPVVDVRICNDEDALKALALRGALRLQRE